MTFEEKEKLGHELVALHLGKPWTFRVMRRSRQMMGACKYWKHSIEVSRTLMEGGDDALFNDAILHEIAHGIAGRDVKHHGREWKAIARKLGARPVACYEVNIPQRFMAKQTQHWFTCDTCGAIGTITRKKRALRYLCRPCNLQGVRSELRWVEMEKR